METERNSNLCNFEAEAELLGGLLIFNEAIADVQTWLKADHFSDEVNAIVYNAILSCHAAGEVSNPITLRGKVNGNEKYLVSLLANASPTTNTKGYGQIIYSLWQKRQIALWCGEAIASLTNEDVMPDEVAAKLVGNVNDLGSADKKRQVVNGSDLVQQVIDDMNNQVRPYSTGMDRLDAAMGGGLHPGLTYGFGARKKVGKTILAGTLSYNLDKAGCKHLLIAGEMGMKQIHQRLLARHANSFTTAFRDKGYQSEQFMNSLGDYSSNYGQNILYQNAPGLTFDDLKQYMSRAAYKFKCKGVILDYWQLVGGKNSKDSDAKHLDNVAQWIADFCREQNMWSVVFAQINQEGNTRGGEGLRLACDQMYQIHRPDVTMPHTYVEMMDTRYTAWGDIGDMETGEAGWMMEERGPYFRDASGEMTNPPQEKKAKFSATGY